jgi:hypothetical protein
LATEAWPAGQIPWIGPGLACDRSIFSPIYQLDTGNF